MVLIKKLEEFIDNFRKTGIVFNHSQIDTTPEYEQGKHDFLDKLVGVAKTFNPEFGYDRPITTFNVDNFIAWVFDWSIELRNDIARDVWGKEEYNHERVKAKLNSRAYDMGKRDCAKKFVKAFKKEFNINWEK
jgi:hypothetical protein